MKSRSSLKHGAGAGGLNESVGVDVGGSGDDLITEGEGVEVVPRVRQQGLLHRRVAGGLIMIVVLLMLRSRGRNVATGSGVADGSLGVGTVWLGGQGLKEGKEGKEGRSGDEDWGGGGISAGGTHSMLRKPPSPTSLEKQGDDGAGERRRYEFSYPLSDRGVAGGGGEESSANCRNSNPSEDAKVAIVLQGKYTRGYLHYCLQSIEKAFGVDEVDVFIYAMYQNDQEREELIGLLDRPIISSALIEKWDGDMYKQIIDTYTKNNDGIVPTPPCCVKGCCVSGPDPCKAKHCSVWESRGVSAGMFSLYRAYRVAMLVYERYRVKVRPDKPYKLMIRGRMDSVFPVIDRDVLWGTDVANYVQNSDVEMWIPFASDGSLDGGISDKVSMGKPDSMSHIFREIAKHVGEANWGTDEMAEVAMWRSIAQVGWKNLIGRFNWSVATVRLELGVPKFKYNDNHKQFHKEPPPGTYEVGEFGTACREGVVPVSDNRGCVKKAEVDDEIFSDEGGGLNIPKPSGLAFCGEFMKDRGQQHVPNFLADKIEDWD